MRLSRFPDVNFYLNIYHLALELLKPIDMDTESPLFNKLRPITYTVFFYNKIIVTMETPVRDRPN